MAIVVVEEKELQAIVAAAVEDGVRRALEVRTSSSPACDWIDADEAAQLVGVSRDYLRRLRDLPRHGSGRAPRYRRSEVDAYIASRGARARPTTTE